MYPNSVRNLIDCLKGLPGVGEKSAERMAFSIINFDTDRIQDFANSLIDIKNSLRRCSVCNNITDMDVCGICANDSRDNGTIFVVEKPKDIILFEKIPFASGPLWFRIFNMFIACFFANCPLIPIIEHM